MRLWRRLGSVDKHGVNECLLDELSPFCRSLDGALPVTADATYRNWTPWEEPWCTSRRIMPCRYGNWPSSFCVLQKFVKFFNVSKIMCQISIKILGDFVCVCERPYFYTVYNSITNAIKKNLFTWEIQLIDAQDDSPGAVLSLSLKQQWSVLVEEPPRVLGDGPTGELLTHSGSLLLSGSRRRQMETMMSNKERIRWKKSSVHT